MQNQNSAEQIEKKGRIAKRWRTVGVWMIMVLLFFALAYGANNRIDITKYTYETDALSASFNGFRIVQLSDLHNKIFAENNEALLREVQDLKDFCDGRIEYIVRDWCSLADLTNAMEIFSLCVKISSVHKYLNDLHMDTPAD